MIVKTISVLALSLLFACGGDDSNEEPKTERVSSKTPYYVENDRIELAAEMQLVGQTSGCSHLLPKILNFSHTQGVTYRVGERFVIGNRRFIKTRPEELKLADSKAVDGDYTVAMDNASALLTFKDGNLDITLTCVY